MHVLTLDNIPRYHSRYVSSHAYTLDNLQL